MTVKKKILMCSQSTVQPKYMDWKRFRNLCVPENHPCCAYMDSELVSLLLTRTNMTWMLIPVDGFQGCSLKFSDLLYGKLFRRFRYSKLKRSKRFNRLIHCFQK